MVRAGHHASLRHRDAERFCEQILPSVSRTFALGIRVLPGALGRAVLSAYLICRIADTIEDEPVISPREKATLFELLLGCFDGPATAEEFARSVHHLSGEPAHLELARHADLVFELFRTLPEHSRRHVSHWVGEMVQGMKKFVILYPDGIRIQTLEEYREYCYYVAGTVGYLLTDLWHEHSASIGADTYQRLRERCRAFAEALQTVNILKDVAQDAARENAIYIPEQLLREYGSSHAALLARQQLSRSNGAMRRLIQLAWSGLEEARAYVLVVPRRALAIRLFCVLPLLFAYATLRDLAQSTAVLVPGGTVKISRSEVRSLLLTGALVIPSNSGVRWLVDRVRARPFVLG